MKIPLLFLSMMFAGSLFSQEVDKVAPPAKVVEKTKTNPEPALRKRSVPQVAPSTGTSSRRRVVPSMSSRTTPPTRVSLGRVPASKLSAKTLTENVTIQLQGSVEGGPALDLAMTGIGPIFRGDVVVGKGPTIVTHSYTVEPTEGGYKIEYSVGFRIKVEHKVDDKVKSVEYRDVSVSGTVIAKEGKRLVISKNGEHELGLLVGKTNSK